MSISTSNITEHVAATGVECAAQASSLAPVVASPIRRGYSVCNTERRALKSSPEQRTRWSLEPGGFAIYWEELDDGIEVSRLLGMQPLVER